MVYLSKKEGDIIIRALSNTSNKEIKSIIEKIKYSEKRIYIKDKIGIRRLLKKAFSEKRKVKIKYCSPHSDELTNRIVDIYQVHKECLVTFCHLREEERTFVIERINSATILNEKYVIPKNWHPESIILDK
ncbi:MAG: WYL domain-containing protein [archaeon]